MQKTLVVYFSRTGSTHTLAEEIAERCGADLDSIEETSSRSGLWGYLRSAGEALKRAVVEIRPPRKNPADYDLVILATPVWAGHVSSPMRAYLVANRAKLKQVAVFSTQSGSGHELAVRDMRELCGRTPVASAASTGAEIRNGRYKDRLDEFVRALALPKAA